MSVGRLTVAAALALTTSFSAQQKPAELGAQMLRIPEVRAAVDLVRAEETQIIEDQIRICEVEAPPFQETRRGQLYAQMLRTRDGSGDRHRAEALAERALAGYRELGMSGHAALVRETLS